MATIKVNRLTNANIYADGNSLLGTAEEITAPEIVQVMTEHKALGMHGKVEFTSGVEKMEGKLKLNSHYRDVLAKVANPTQVVNLQIRANLEGYIGASRATQVPCVIYMEARFKKLPLGVFKQHDNVEIELEYACTSMKLEVDGENLVEFDAMSNIYKVMGVDILGTYRANIGG